MVVIPPRRPGLRVCYICGKEFGSQSLPIMNQNAWRSGILKTTNYQNISGDHHLLNLRLFLESLLV
uniref:Uncharacterized protein n=1 Tax=Naja naja TaxID=35670 RepID=A0A8C6VAN2_NAJNA